MSFSQNFHVQKPIFQKFSRSNSSKLSSKLPRHCLNIALKIASILPSNLSKKMPEIALQIPLKIALQNCIQIASHFPFQISSQIASQMASHNIAYQNVSNSWKIIDYMKARCPDNSVLTLFRTRGFGGIKNALSGIGLNFTSVILNPNVWMVNFHKIN